MFMGFIRFDWITLWGLVLVSCPSAQPAYWQNVPVAHRSRLRTFPVTVLVAVLVLVAVAVAELAFSSKPAIAAEVDGAAVAVCGFAWSVAVFLLPRLRDEPPALDEAQVAALPVGVPTGKLPSVVRDRNTEFTQLRESLRKLSGEFVVLAGMGVSASQPS